MRDRTRTLLGLALFTSQSHGGEIARTRLMKYAFLMSQMLDTESKGFAYEFVPYLYGPFSFELYHDIAILSRDGFLSVERQGEDERWLVSSGRQSEIRAQFDRLPWKVRDAAWEVVAANKALSLDDLLRDVYAAHPWYGCLSNRTDLKDDKNVVPQSIAAVYTAGYEGKSVDSFFNGLLTSGIKCVLDVRRNPVSHKYGFAGSSMKAIALKLGLDYRHLPELGIAGSERQGLGTADSYRRLFDTYEEKILAETNQTLEEACALLKAQPSVLVCVESNVALCHRGRLASIIAKRTGLRIQHLP